MSPARSLYLVASWCRRGSDASDFFRGDEQPGIPSLSPPGATYIDRPWHGVEHMDGNIVNV